MIFSGNRADSTPGLQLDARKVGWKNTAAWQNNCVFLAHACGSCTAWWEGGSSVAAWGLGTCPDFPATNDLSKDAQSSEHQEAKEWTKLTKKTDGRAVRCPRTTHELQGTAHCVSVMWLPNPAHFQAVIQEKHRGQGHRELSIQPRI